jgi:Asp-tRNA(Asn)/Glu-tRNA(Gln) amidotransferase B subunit
MTNYKPTMGLEIHVALNTKQKLFSNTLAEYSINEFSLFDCGTPGVLPILNKEPIEKATAFGLAANSTINLTSYFDRKHYFYPDLPLGYQITQQFQPIVVGGKIPFYVDGEKKYGILEKAHVECDAAKSKHFGSETHIDISRVASPLLEIVSTPCLHTPEECVAYAKAVYDMVTAIDICDGKMEEGSFRVDASISLSTTDSLGTRVEIKNISSFAFLKEALYYEIERQTELLNSGGSVVLETRLYDEDKKQTISMRDKESVAQYRYMPDPDIPPVVIDDSFVTYVKSIYKTDYYAMMESFSSRASSYATSEQIKKAWRYNYLFDYATSEKAVKTILFSLDTISKQITVDDFLYLMNSDISGAVLSDVLKQWDTTDKTIAECMPVFDSSALDNAVAECKEKFPEQWSQRDNPKIVGFLMGQIIKSAKFPIDKAKLKARLEK